MVSIEKTLENVFDKPLRKLTEHQRKFVFHHIKDWAIMSSEQRRAKATEADRQFQNKERLKSTRYIKPLTEEELEQYTAGWDDATLEANHWFSQSMVSPTNAAMLLCQHNPNEISFDDAVQLLPKHKGHGIIFDPKESHSKYRSLPTTGPQQLIQLQQRFNALNTTAPADRSLRDWLEYARSQNIEYNSWIDKYAGAISAQANEAERNQTEAVKAAQAQSLEATTPVLTASDSPAPQNKIVHSIKTRRDALTPVIEFAQGQCRDPRDTAEVWAVLQVLAEKKTAPLIGATEEGLQYLKNGNAANFNRESLRKRLGR